jgi:hypothetical protein
VNRLHRVLEDAGITLSTVTTNVMGAGRAMLEAPLQGATHPDRLADLAKDKLRKKFAALRHLWLKEVVRGGSSRAGSRRWRPATAGNSAESDACQRSGREGLTWEEGRSLLCPAFYAA